MSPLLHLLAEQSRSGLRWHVLPPPWALWLLVLPAIAAAAWWAYRRETEVPAAGRVLLATLRGLALLFVLLLFFGPYSELHEVRTVRSNMVLVVDHSQSMGTIDGYEAEDARLLSRAAGVPESAVSSMNRLDLVKRVLANAGHSTLEDWTRDFRVHVFSFGSQATPVASTGESAEEAGTAGDETPADRIRRLLGEIQATDPATRIGQAVSAVSDTFRLRDERVAAIVVVSDGQDNGTVAALTPEQAGRRAGSLHIPVFAVGVGDPRSPRNIHVGNLRAKEVVLAGDDAVFEFSAHAKGFEGRRVRVEMQVRDAGSERGRPVQASPSDVVLDGGDRDQEVRVTHRFTEPGVVTVRIGIPVQPEEKIHSDNFVEHTVRVIDRKIKVLFVEGYPRWEFGSLSNALIRDRDTMLAHTLLLDSDPDTPQRRSQVPDWPPLDASRGLPARAKLFEYDVIVLGDVDWRDLSPTDPGDLEALLDIRDFVDKGGGLVLLSGKLNNPWKYKDTDLQGLFPIVIDRSAERADPAIDTTTGFNLRLTPEGAESPLMNVLGEAAASKEAWEDDPSFRQFWCYPALRPKTLARVLAVSAHPSHTDPRHGARPAVATMPYGRGRVLWLGIDDLWRMRRETGDRFYYRFYGEAVRFLATYRLLGGNKRFKILTDRDQYGIDEPVRITLDVLDADYERARAETQTVVIDMPGAQPGSRESVEVQVPVDPSEKGTYRKTMLTTRAGEYRIRGVIADTTDEVPEKIFRVVESSVEARNLLLDRERLESMARASDGGRYLHLSELPSLRPEKADIRIPTDKRDDELWDSAWSLVIATGLLAAEWLLRKRWHLV